MDSVRGGSDGDSRFARELGEREPHRLCGRGVLRGRFSRRERMWGPSGSYPLWQPTRSGTALFGVHFLVGVLLSAVVPFSAGVLIDAYGFAPVFAGSARADRYRHRPACAFSARVGIIDPAGRGGGCRRLSGLRVCRGDEGFPRPSPDLNAPTTSMRLG